MATRAAGLSLRVAPVSDEVQDHDVENLARSITTEPTRRDEDAGTNAPTKWGDTVRHCARTSSSVSCSHGRGPNVSVSGA